jgi:predicted aspartyl protease
MNMGVKLMLDASALELLLDRNPELKLVLTQAVIAETANRLVNKQTTDKISKLMAGLAHQLDTTAQQAAATVVKDKLGHFDGSWTASFKINPTMVEALKREVSAAVSAEIDKQLAGRIGDALAILPEKIAAAADQVNPRVERKIDEAVDQVVNARVTARLAEIRAALAKAA